MTIVNSITVPEIGRRKNTVQSLSKLIMEFMKADDYVGATLTLRTLYVQTNLTPEQKKAIEDAQKAVSDKMYDAANKGDAKAKGALEELRKVSGR